MRQYGFDADELIYRSDGNLPTGGDPKLFWARFHPERYPIEVNTASRDRSAAHPWHWTTERRAYHDHAS